MYKIICVVLLALPLNLFAASEKSNVLWITTDDQRPDALACFNRAETGKPESPLGYVESPRIDALTKEGVLFTKAYCNSPACAPSRSSMHLGRYPHHSGIYGFESSHTAVDTYKPTIPSVLQKEGYQTAHFGKKGVRIAKINPAQYQTEVDTRNDIGRQGLGDYFYHGALEDFLFPDGRKVTTKRSGKLSAQEKAARDKLDAELGILRSYTRRLNGLVLGGVSPKPAEDTSDAHIVKQFQRFLKNKNQKYTLPSNRSVNGANTDKPLMIHLGFTFPHTPVLPPKNYRDRFKTKKYKVPAFDKKELDKLPNQLKNFYEILKVDTMKMAEKQQAIQDYYAFCAHGDNLIGGAVESFKEYCKQNNQGYLIIIATGDHSWHLGENGIEAKFGPYDYSNHTAVVVLSSDTKRFPPGQVNKNFVEYVDFYPTILTAAGIDISASKYEYLDGIDLGKTVKAPTREYILGEINGNIGPRAWIRTKDFAFSMRSRPDGAKPGQNVNWALTASRKDVEMALFDLRIDALERNNVANDKDYIKVADWFRKKLGDVVLGDGRVEVEWSKNKAHVSTFAEGADNKKIELPPSIVPKVIVSNDQRAKEAMK